MSQGQGQSNHNGRPKGRKTSEKANTNSNGHVIGYSFVFDWFVGCCKNFLANKKTEQSKSLEIK